MRSKSILLLALALGCGLVASIGISQLMDARNRGADLGDRQPVFVALADVNANDELTAQNIKLEEWPKNIVPAGALTQLEDVEGKRSRVKIYAGEPILSSKLLGPNESVGAAKDIPPGYRVAHVRVDGTTGSNNLILPGDRVDVLVFRSTGGNDMQATASKIVLQDIKVFAVDTQTETEFTKSKDDQTEPMTAKTISLLVTPRQAEILHAATEMSGSTRLVLRNPEDDTHYTSDGATIADIFGPDEPADRKAEDGEKTAESSDKEHNDLTAWLSGQKGQQQVTPPPVPGLPQPMGPRGKMIVMYGSELMQVDFPSDGGLPINPMQNDNFSPAMGPSSQLTGGQPAPTPAPPEPNVPANPDDAGAADKDTPDKSGEFIEDPPGEKNGTDNDKDNTN
ncbi:MAG: Flp pilus assembly protein CpaB [Pirellulales bacterium]